MRHLCRSSSCAASRSGRSPVKRNLIKLRLRYPTIKGRTRLLKYSPPRWVSPAVASPLKHAILNTQQGHIEGSTTEIIDDDLDLTALLVEAVRDRGGGGLLDDAQDLEACDYTSILGGLALGVIEVGGNCDDRMCNLCTEVCLCGLLHLGKDHGRDLFGSLWKSQRRQRVEKTSKLVTDKLSGIPFVLHLDAGLSGFVEQLEGPVLHVAPDVGVVELASDETLRVEYSVGGVRVVCVLCRVADPVGVSARRESMARKDLQWFVISEADPRRCGTMPMVVCDDLDTATALHTVRSQSEVG